MSITECLNIGCGLRRFNNAVNVDMTYKKNDSEPNVVANALALPFPKETFECVLASHILEHIPKNQHYIALKEWRRVLIPKGKAMISVPEFDVCLRNYLDNYQGNIEYWEMTIFGACRYPGDEHKSGITQRYLADLLFTVGFSNLRWERTDRELACIGVTAIKSELLPGRLGY